MCRAVLIIFISLVLISKVKSNVNKTINGTNSLPNPPATPVSNISNKSGLNNTKPSSPIAAININKTVNNSTQRPQVPNKTGNGTNLQVIAANKTVLSASGNPANKISNNTNPNQSNLVPQGRGMPNKPINKFELNKNVSQLNSTQPTNFGSGKNATSNFTAAAEAARQAWINLLLQKMKEQQDKANQSQAIAKGSAVGEVKTDPNVEHAPTEEVKDLVAKHKMGIKIRAKLPIETDKDREDLEAAPLDSLAFIEYQDGNQQIYLIKVNIGYEYFVHIKISAPRLPDLNPANPKRFIPDIENSTLMTVLNGREDMDRVTREEFDRPVKNSKEGL